METYKIIKEIEKLEKLTLTDYLPYSVYGVRFDSRTLEIGQIIGNSKSNYDRYDSRDFPEYGTEEYDSMPELDGTCAYFVFDGDREERYQFLDRLMEKLEGDQENKNWYLIAGDLSQQEGEDSHEILIKNAIVISKL